LQLALQTHAGRDIGKQLLDGLQPQGVKHGLDIGAGMDIEADWGLLHRRVGVSLIHVVFSRCGA
jgi:hypothetical protein